MSSSTERQKFINRYGDIFDIDVLDFWENMYTDPFLFWKSQYARSYAKELFDIATIAQSNKEYSRQDWIGADYAEGLARTLENLLIAKEASSMYSQLSHNSEEY
jgi:hypothetical protein